MNYDESKVSKPKVKKPKAPEPIKLVDDSPGWGVFIGLVAFVAIGLMLAMYIKRPSVTAPVDPAAIEVPKDSAKPAPKSESAQDIFDKGFGR
jgi:hypothetical protein